MKMAHVTCPALLNIQQMGMVAIGYMRDIEQSIISQNKDANTLNTIPEPILNLCLLYIINEEFSSELSQGKLSLDLKSITKVIGGIGWNCSSYGSNIIPSTSIIICDWGVKIHDSGIMDSYKAAIKIGIASRWKNDEKGPFYCLNGYNELKQSLEEYTNWGKVIGQGDVIRLSLDLQKKCIRYGINGDDLGIAFQNVEISDDISYRLNVELCDVNANVEHVYFSIIHS